MTPEEFLEEVKKLDHIGGDAEDWHISYDDLIETLLTELGYGAGIEYASHCTRWYA